MGFNFFILFFLVGPVLINACLSADRVRNGAITLQTMNLNLLTSATCLIFDFSG